MKVVFIKAFQNTPHHVMYPGEVHDLWDTTAERAVKEGKALYIPEGMTAQMVIDNNKIKKGK